MRKKLFQQIIRAVGGLVICAFGAYLTVVANIGMSPWNALHQGLSEQLHISYGTVYLAVSVIVVLLDILMKEPVGLGTVMDALLVGSMTDFFLYINPFPICHRLLYGTLLVCLAVFITSIGQWLYMSAGLSCGPRDSLLVAVGKRLKRLPIGVVNALLLLVIIGLGLLLKGPVGIGTVITVCTWSSAMQLVFRVVRFEPRDVTHESIWESLKKLKLAANESKENSHEL